MRDDDFLIGPNGRAVLPAVPLFGDGNPSALALMDLAADRLHALLDDGRRHYGNAVLAVGDAISRRWLARSGNPYLPEIDAIAGRLRRPGAVMLNMSYEWSCSAGVAADPVGRGSRLLRTLDWPMPGLGRNVVVAMRDGGAGPYYDVTWPGHVGILTAMAPGRFSAALNQPPLRRYTGACSLDWIAGRVAMWRERALPPTHLLRRVFETCRSYADALRALTETPICTPAFFSLSGVDAAEGCVIERLEREAAVHEAPSCITNHWLSVNRRGHDRGNDSVGRLADVRRALPLAGDDFGWVVPPVLNRNTRLAVVANAARGYLAVQGWERSQPATAVLTVSDPAPAVGLAGTAGTIPVPAPAEAS